MRTYEPYLELRRCAQTDLLLCALNYYYKSTGCFCRAVLSFGPILLRSMFGCSALSLPLSILIVLEAQTLLGSQSLLPNLFPLPQMHSVSDGIPGSPFLLCHRLTRGKASLASCGKPTLSNNVSGTGWGPVYPGWKVAQIAKLST